MSGIISTSNSDALKFQFSDFDLEQDAGGTPVEPTYSVSDLSSAEALARSMGYQAGFEAARETIEADTGRMLNNIENAVAALMAETRLQADGLAAASVSLAAEIARRLLPVFAASSAAAEIEGLITACFRDRPDEARLVIRVPDHLLDAIQGRIAALAETAGFTGRTILLADPVLSGESARVEWANGGADWNFAAQLDELASAAARIARNMKSRPAPVPPAVEPDAAKESEE